MPEALVDEVEYRRDPVDLEFDLRLQPLTR
jgi:hypothetical protein